MFTWIQNNWPAISVIGTSVACAGALIGWHYVSMIPEANAELWRVLGISCFLTGMTILYLIPQDGWGRRKRSLLDRPLPILASFVWPMFIGTWNVLWDIPNWIASEECTALSTKGYNYVWRDGICYTPEQWQQQLCDKHPTMCK
jgi:hypothetical protein